MTDCIFCKIINGEIPSAKVYEDSEVIAFLDIKPINPGHVLVVPKLHAQLVGELAPEIMAKVIQVGVKINSALRRSSLKAEGVNFWLADGGAAGQEVGHVHLHVIPRYQTDGFGFKFPPHYGKPAGNIKPEEIALELANFLQP